MILDTLFLLKEVYTHGYALGMNIVSSQLRPWVVVCLLSVLPTVALSHPVTFEDGIAFSSVFRPNAVLVESAYSTSARFALGLTYMRQEMDDERLQGGFVNGNVLLYRRNAAASQANLYGIVGVGTGGDKWSDPLGLAAFQTDFETSRFYTAWMGRAVTDGTSRWWQTTYRIGFAPYEAEFNELQSWLVSQVSYMPQMASTPNVSMLLRFFYRTVLWEMGGDLHGRPWIQLMVHY